MCSTSPKNPTNPTNPINPMNTFLDCFVAMLLAVTQSVVIASEAWQSGLPRHFCKCLAVTL